MYTYFYKLVYKLAHVLAQTRWHTWKRSIENSSLPQRRQRQSLTHRLLVSTWIRNSLTQKLRSKGGDTQQSLRGIKDGRRRGNRQSLHWVSRLFSFLSSFLGFETSCTSRTYFWQIRKRELRNNIGGTKNWLTKESTSPFYNVIFVVWV